MVRAILKKAENIYNKEEESFNREMWNAAKAGFIEGVVDGCFICGAILVSVGIVRIVKAIVIH